jgi:hypothetical protein
MKRKDFLGLSLAAPLGLVGTSMARGEGPPKSRKATFDWKASLSPRQRRTALQIAEVTYALLVKAHLNRRDPVTYPLSKAPNSLEQRTARALRKMAPVTSPKWEAVLRNPERLKHKLSGLGRLDWKADLTPTALALLPEMIKKASQPGTYIGDARLNLDLHSLYCADETDPEVGVDRIILGGMLVGPNGRLALLSALYCGEFDDGYITNFGVYPLGWFGYQSQTNYPQNFYAIFQLIEIDVDTNEATQAMDQVLLELTQIIPELWPDEDPSQIACAVCVYLEAFLPEHFRDSILIPSYNPIRLNSYDAAPGPKRNTGAIKGNDGTYRVKYSWRVTR